MVATWDMCSFDLISSASLSSCPWRFWPFLLTLYGSNPAGCSVGHVGLSGLGAGVPANSRVDVAARIGSSQAA